MSNQLTISHNKPSITALNYEKLRQEGITHIQQLAGKIWTDHGTHDPGITILEFLCMGLTDVSLRAQAPVEDLLATGLADDPDIDNSLYLPQEILNMSPLTINDFRRLLIDIEGVRNAWLEPSNKEKLAVNCAESKLERISSIAVADTQTITLGGLYDVKVEYELKEDLNKGVIKRKIKKVLHQSRNLCEDFRSISEILFQSFRLCADISLTSEAEPDKVHAEILHAVEIYLNPTVQFKTLSQMLKKGYTIDEIYQGPLLECGFIEEEELEATDLQSEVYLSDIIRIIMSITGVVTVDDAVLAPKEGELDNNGQWVIKVEQGKRPVLDTDESRLIYRKSGLPIQPNELLTKDYLILLRNDAQARLCHKPVNHWKAPKGTVRENLSQYRSIQYDFPRLYGIGDNALPPYEYELRKTQVNRFKAYLLFFDQLIANYLAQLVNVSSVFSISGDISRTYFVQSVEYEKITKDLLKTTQNETDWNSNLHRLAESQDLFLDRRNRILDHLLARFSENFREYIWPSLTAASKTGEIAEDDIPEEVIKSKEKFLQNYTVISRNRAKSFNYSNSSDLWNSDNVAGVKKRICYLLGIANCKRHNLSTETSEGMFLVEHILMRPLSKFDVLMSICPGADCDSAADIDPYSCCLSIILPAFAGRFKDMEFRKFAEKVIREELPAHVLPRVCWLNEKEMNSFQKDYKAWLKENAPDPFRISIIDKRSRSLRRLNTRLNNIKSVYPQRTLYDCEDPNSDSNPLTLNASRLGTMEE